jgi:RNA polymerase sigma-70 factor (ECF subfamily)
MANGNATVARLWLWARQARATDWDARFAEALPRVYNFFRYRVGDGPLAEDLTSITFEKAWRARERYREDRAAFGTWLFTVARNVAVDHFRSDRPTAPLEAA